MGLIQHFENYIGAICLAAVLIIVWSLAQIPFNIWLPGYTLLPEWLWDRTVFMLVMVYYPYIIIPACLFGTAIFYFKVLKNT